jgi:hypothetical protein
MEVEYFLEVEWVIGNLLKFILTINLKYGTLLNTVGHKTTDPNYDLCGKEIRHHKFPDNALHPSVNHFYKDPSW